MLNDEFFKTEFKDTPQISFATPLRQFFLTLIGEDPSEVGEPFAITMDPATKELPITQMFTQGANTKSERFAAAVEFLSTQYGASPNTKMLQELENILYSGDNIREDLTIRGALQQVGTDWARKYWPDIWISITESNIKAALANNNAHVLITDCRFPNEAAMVKSMGGKIIKIERSSNTEVDNHISELDLGQEFIYIIIGNDGGVQDLRLVAQYVINGLGDTQNG